MEFWGMSLREADYRAATNLTILTVIRRRGKKEARILPEAGLVLQEGDALIVMGAEADIHEQGGETA